MTFLRHKNSVNDGLNMIWAWFFINSKLILEKLELQHCTHKCDQVSFGSKNLLQQSFWKQERGLSKSWFWSQLLHFALWQDLLLYSWNGLTFVDWKLKTCKKIALWFHFQNYFYELFEKQCKKDNCEGALGFEPRTYRSAVDCSTIELYPLLTVIYLKC